VSLTLRTHSTVTACGLLFAGVPGCAVSEIPTQDIEPRFASAGESEQPYRWTSDLGWLEPDDGSWGSDEHVRVESRKAFDAGYYADALAGFLVLEDRAAAPTVKDLNFYLAECFYRLGHYDEALEYFRPVYGTDYPSAQLVDQARERVFEIGMDYLKGRKTTTMLGLSFRSPDTGIDIINELIIENPHLSFADDGGVAIADHYFDDRQFPEAVPIYDRVIEMDADEWDDYAEYRAALAEFRQIRGVDYDQSKMQESLRRFNLYLQHHPRGDHWEDARAKKRELAEMEGEKNLRIAKFYLDHSQPRACEVYLRLVLDRYPNSLAAREAREIRRKLDDTRGRW